MKTPSKHSHRTKAHQCGVPVDVELKKRLRNRSLPLSKEQRAALKEMGIKVSSNTTEKEAVSMVKRIVNFSSVRKDVKFFKLIDPDYVSPYDVKTSSKRPKTKRTCSLRQHRMEVLTHRISEPHEVINSDGTITEFPGSRRAEKQLNRMSGSKIK